MGGGYLLTGNKNEGHLDKMNEAELLKEDCAGCALDKGEEEDIQTNKKQTPWSESASELYRPSDLRLSAK
jgi:hypothetical protein